MTKRKSAPGRRITPRRADPRQAHGVGASFRRPSGVQGQSASTKTPAPTRYTPPKADYRIRPPWHRVAGRLGIALGMAIAIANDAMIFVEGLTLLPMGHQELYLLLGVAVSGGSTWFLGLFDRGTTIYD